MATRTRREQLSRRAFLLGGFPLFGWFRRKQVRRADIGFRVLRHGRGATRYLVIHGDEKTAAEAVTEQLKTHDGVAHLVLSDTRYVTIHGGRADPNRIFSRAGAEASFRRLNPQWSVQQLSAALDWLDKERPGLLRTLLPPREGLMIAVHNNARGYSVEEEIPISNQTSLPKRAEPHEFFLCTDPKDFGLIKSGPYNVVLQSSATGPDDGSLSRYCASNRIRYVNLEVGIGKVALQIEMLNWLAQTLPAKRAD